ncbi:MAG: hypothetical protein KGL35_16550, partial [Bradyrhizobium sp.]|nr:hypothetical protein [Bradyrhizobium sp.]
MSEIRGKHGVIKTRYRFAYNVVLDDMFGGAPIQMFDHELEHEPGSEPTVEAEPWDGWQAIDELTPYEPLGGFDMVNEPPHYRNHASGVECIE